METYAEMWLVLRKQIKEMQDDPYWSDDIVFATLDTVLKMMDELEKSK